MAEDTYDPFGLFKGSWLRVHVTIFKETWLRTYVALLAFSKEHGYGHMRPFLPLQRDMAKGLCGPFQRVMANWLLTHGVLLAFSKGHE